MSYLVDADIIINAILNRRHELHRGDRIWTLIESKRIDAYVTNLGLDKILNVTRAFTDDDDVADSIYSIIDSLLSTELVKPLLLQEARKLKIQDFESSIELVCAKHGAYDALITCDKEAINNNLNIPTFYPEKFVDFLVEKETRRQIKIHKFSQKQDILCHQADDKTTHSLHYLASQISSQITHQLNEFGYDFNRNQDIFKNILNSEILGASKYQCNFFCGREIELRDIASKISGPQKVLVLLGQGGVGKTSLALAYASQNLKEARAKNHHLFSRSIFIPPMFGGKRDQTTKICFVDYLGYLIRELSDHFDDGFRVNRFLDNRNLQFVYEKLATEPTLLILDGLEEGFVTQDEIDRFTKQLPGDTRVLITSREMDLGYMSYQVEPLQISTYLRIVEAYVTRTHTILNPNSAIQIYEGCGKNLWLSKFCILQVKEGHSISDLEDQFSKKNKSTINLLTKKLVKRFRFCLSEEIIAVLGLISHSMSVNLLATLVDTKEDSEELANSLAELAKESLIFKEKGRYSLNPMIQEIAISLCRNNLARENIYYQRLLDWAISFSEKYGGLDWEDWYIKYDLIEKEWNLFQVILSWCLFKDDYSSLKRIWSNINHFCDLYGYWRDRIFWLDKLIDISSINGDHNEYINSLSRKSWTLIMTDHKERLEEAATLLEKIWPEKDDCSLEIQLSIAHHRCVCYLHLGNLENTEVCLQDQENLLQEFKESHPTSHFYTRQEINLLRNRGSFWVAKKEFKKARTTFSEVLRKAAKLNWRRGICYAHNQLADIEIGQGRLKVAECHLWAGLPIAKRNRNQRRLARYEKSFALLTKARGKESESKQWAFRAFRNLKGVGNEKESQNIQEEFDAYEFDAFLQISNLDLECSSLQPSNQWFHLY